VRLSGNSSQVDSYYELCKEGHVFSALSLITGLPAYSATTAQGSPLLWNNTGPLNGGGTRVMAVIVGLSVGWTTAPGASGAIGIAVGTGQTTAPSSTTAVDAVGNLNAQFASQTPLCNVYQKGTVTNGGNMILVTHEVSTAAGNPSQPVFVPLDGLVLVPPGGWCSVAGAAAIASMVAKISLVWAEVPY
jgi:hypothetical protein